MGVRIQVNGFGGEWARGEEIWPLMNADERR
jgi:hypothetical protein